MNGIRGEAALLSDPYPLRPHLTLRSAGSEDPPCTCGSGAEFVLLEIDRALEPPHPYDLACRICSDWRHMLVSVCGTCLPAVLAQTVDDFRV